MKVFGDSREDHLVYECRSNIVENLLSEPQPDSFQHRQKPLDGMPFLWIKLECSIEVCFCEAFAGDLVNYRWITGADVDEQVDGISELHIAKVESIDGLHGSSVMPS